LSGLVETGFGEEQAERLLVLVTERQGAPHSDARSAATGTDEEIECESRQNVSIQCCMKRAMTVVSKQLLEDARSQSLRLGCHSP
jgi:hypothetical protein